MAPGGSAVLPVDGRTLKSMWAVQAELCIIGGKKEKKRKPGLGDEGRIWEELGREEGLIMIKIYCMHIGNPRRVNKSIFYFKCMSALPACTPGAHGEQKGVLNPLKLELQMVVYCHLGAGN